VDTVGSDTSSLESSGGRGAGTNGSEASGHGSNSEGQNSGKRARLHLPRAVGLVYRSAPGITVLSLALALVQAALPLVPLYVVRLIVNAIAGGADPASVILLVAVAAGATMVSMVFRGVATYVREAQAQALGDYVQSLIHEKSLALDLGYYETFEFFDTLHRTQEEAPYRPAVVVDGLMTVLRALLSLLGIAVVLLTVLPWYSIAALAGASGPLAIARVISSRRQFRWHLGRTTQERRALYLNWLLTGRDHAKELRIFGLGALFASRFKAERALLRRERLALAARRTGTEVGAALIQTAAVFTVVAVVAVRALAGATTLGDLVMLLQVVQRGQALMSELLAGANSLYESNLYLSKVFEFMGLRPTVPDPIQSKLPWTVAPERVRSPGHGRPLDSETAPSPPPNGRSARRGLKRGIELRNVSFAYPGIKRLVLNDVSLTAQRGELVALVGDNGAGKTTLLKLLCRFYDPSNGTISVDGVDLRNISKREWWGCLTALFQDPARYHDTVSDNIWFGNPERQVNWERIHGAARKAGAAAFVAGLPYRFATPLGRFLQDGVELSGGQWKKLALARTFYRDCRLAILDEPTNGIDPDSETELLTTLRDWSRDKAVLLVTHRIAAARIADRIYVMQEGAITEEGTHESLRDRGGFYARMFAQQLHQIEHGVRE